MHFVSCDWGSSSFRLTMADMSSGPIGEVIQSGHGCTDVTGPGSAHTPGGTRFARYLADQLSRLGAKASSPSVPVVLSGMVTSSHGWLDLPYAHTPVSLSGEDLVVQWQEQPDGRRLLFVSGIRSDDDVMRGEECQLVGLKAWMSAQEEPERDRLRVILPGTHCKHVRVNRGHVLDFRTFITGELYAILREHSVLAHSLPGAQETDGTIETERLAAGVHYVMLHGLAASLFNVRVGMLLRNEGPLAADSFLNGMLIGAEFDPRAFEETGERLVLCATGRLRKMYVEVLDVLGYRSRTTIVPEDIVKQLAVLGHGQILRAQHHGDAIPSDVRPKT